MKKGLISILIGVMLTMLCIIFVACGEDKTNNPNNTQDSTEQQTENHEHTWSEWKITKEATSDNDGMSERVCSDCGEIEKKAIDATGHTQATIPSKESVGLAYSVNPDGVSCTITGIGECTDTSINIPASIDGYKVTAIGDQAFSFHFNITNVIIPDGVTSIGERAFYSCNVISITVPASVTSIGEAAFIGCTKLVEVYNLSSLTVEKGASDNEYLGFYALDIYTSANEKSKIWTDTDGYIFYEDGNTCYLLGYTGNDTELILPANCNGKQYAIFRWAFSYCGSLKSIIIPNSVTDIGSHAFDNCVNLTGITIPDGITSIEANAFYNCVNLTGITIPDSVTTIGEGAFSYCSGLTSITIPDSVTSIGERAFSSCYKLVEVYNLSSITIEKGSSDNGHLGSYALDIYTSATPKSNLCTDTEGYIFYENGDTCYLLCYIGNDPDLILPKNCNGKQYDIYKYAFKSCWRLTSITIPSGVMSIGEEAFKGCTKLTSVTINNGITSIGENAFSECTSLTSIIIPDSVTSIGDYAFSQCSSLMSVTIPTSVTSIGRSAFYGCSKLVEVYNLSSLTIEKDSSDNGYLGYYALDIYTSTNEKSRLWTNTEGYIFYENGDVCYLLGYMGNDTELILPSNCNGKHYAIYKNAFRGCENLKSIIILNSVTSIGDYAFIGCTGLTSITIPDSVTGIKFGSFSECFNLTSITIPESVTIIEGSAFEGCTSLTNITIPESVTIIEGSAFEGCTSLTNITIPESVTNIGLRAFCYCKSLTSITIPNSVTFIVPEAFQSCRSLTSITFNGTMEQWNGIKKGNNWNRDTGNYTVYCIDGNITK